MTDAIDDVKKRLAARKSKTTIQSSDLLSTGSTLLNLACTGKPNGGFGRGKYYFLVGDSSSGKSWLSLTCFAEACINENFKDYDLIHDNVEDGTLMDFAAYFGQAVADRVIPPRGTRENPIPSRSVEEFYYNLDDAFKRKKPFIYVLDSMDGIASEEDIEKFDEKKKHAEKVERAKAKGKEVRTEVSGSYGTGKAKANSQNLRLVVSRLNETGSILIIISQTRDNIGRNASFGDGKTRSGGHALKFYATLELWTSIEGRVKKVVNGKEREQGILSRIQVKKNRQTGRNRRVTVPILHSFGIDDTGSCVDYLVAEGHWKDKDGIKADEFEVKKKREELIRHIESNDLEKELKRIVSTVWHDVETQLQVERKSRYE